jgi:acyl carrier protein
MELNNFITNVADQFDDTDISVFMANTNFRELDEWSSLIALAILNMIDKKYGIRLTPVEMRAANTIRELFDLVQSKQ